MSEEQGSRMKTLGLLGGMSWESTALYYQIINETVRAKLGGLHSAKLILHSVDFHDIEQLQQEDRWEEAGSLLARAAHQIELAGADLLVLCTNTMHEIAGAIEQTVQIPLLHIADATAQEIRESGMVTVGLLGTRFTMERDFYRGRLLKKYGLNVLTPDESDRTFVHRVIYEELCLGKIREASRNEYKKIIQKLVDRGAEGIVLGCTEIPLLVQPEDSSVPLFDTTKIHARKAAEWAIHGFDKNTDKRSPSLL